jgi:hypothetical protein
MKAAKGERRPRWPCPSHERRPISGPSPRPAGGRTQGTVALGLALAMVRCGAFWGATTSTTTTPANEGGRCCQTVRHGQR